MATGGQMQIALGTREKGSLPVPREETGELLLLQLSSRPRSPAWGCHSVARSQWDGGAWPWGLGETVAGADQKGFFFFSGPTSTPGPAVEPFAWPWLCLGDGLLKGP